MGNHTHIPLFHQDIDPAIFVYQDEFGISQALSSLNTLVDSQTAELTEIFTLGNCSIRITKYELDIWDTFP